LVGRGGREGAVELCRGCSGTGTQMHIQQLLPGFIQQVQSMCHECQGQGERINPRDRCKNCQGRKIARERKVLDVHIDAGMLTGNLLSPFRTVSVLDALSTLPDVMKLCSIQIIF